jgi:hypothetical protein
MDDNAWEGLEKTKEMVESLYPELYEPLHRFMSGVSQKDQMREGLFAALHVIGKLLGQVEGTALHSGVKPEVLFVMAKQFMQLGRQEPLLKPMEPTQKD